MDKWWNDRILENESKSLISSQFNIEDRIVLIKNKYSAVISTGLEKILKEKGITQVLITGVMTHLCCETTARDAFMRNFKVFFVSDATATYREELHIGTLRAISHGFGVCLFTDEIL